MVKVITMEQAVAQVHDDAVVMIGGFLACGTPEKLITTIVEKGVKNLTVIANDSSYPDKGIGRLVAAKQVKKLIATHIGTNSETAKQMNAKTMEVVLVPQGTLAEQIRAGGTGLGGILTPTGLGTIVAEGKQTILVKGKEYLLETAITADVALVKAYKADESGNLVFRRSARNFNPLIAMAAETVIVEAENIVPVGQIDPDDVMLPRLFVDYIVQG